MRHSLQRWHMKGISHTHLFYKIFFCKLALGKWLGGVKVWKLNQNFSVLNPKLELLSVQFLYDSHNVAKHRLVQIIHLTQFILNQKMRKF